MSTHHFLPASAYVPGDRVVGEDGDKKIFGRVSNSHSRRSAENGFVLVFWDVEEYDSTSLGHEVPADLLQLWPHRSHAARFGAEIDKYLRGAPLLDRAVGVAKISLAFGRVERVTRHEDGVRPETDTDHTVMLGLLACDLARGLCLSLDLGLLAQFSLVHDIVEVKANDTQTLVIDDAGRAAKAEREAAAKAELKEELGRCWLIETLERYERQDCPESRFVRVLDKVLPKLTHLLNGCVAAKALTDEAGFKAAHGAQAADLLRNYPDVAAEVHELLRASMEASEEMWARDTREGASQEE